MKIKPYLTGTICAILLFLLSGYLLLDTFVISRAYAAADTDQSSTVFATALKNAEQNSDENTDLLEESSSEPASENVLVIVGDASSESSSKSSKSGARHTAKGNGQERPSRNNTGTNSNRSGKRSAANSSVPSSSTEEKASSEVTVSVSDYPVYDDGNIRITLNRYTVSDTEVYVADVQTSNASWFKTAFANATYGRNITAKTSTIAAQNDAVLAVNGDYYGARESGYVIRNGIVYRDISRSDTEILCVYADGTMQIRNTGDVSAEELIEEGVWQAFSFGPALVEDGAVSVNPSTEVGKAMASNPRTALGIVGTNHYLFVVSDGRTSESDGLTLYELATFLQSLGATTAYNLDGGGSSTMWYLGEVINNPTSNGTIRERGVSDIVYIG